MPDPKNGSLNERVKPAMQDLASIRDEIQSLAYESPEVAERLDALFNDLDDTIDTLRQITSPDATAVKEQPCQTPTTEA